MTDSVVMLGELGGQTTTMVGRKARTLDRVLREGIDVPPGFVLPTGMFHTFLAHKGIGKRIAALLSKVDTTDQASVEDNSRRIMAEIAKADMPRELVIPIRQAYERMSYGKELSEIPKSTKGLVMNRNLSFVAVRSSLPDDDEGSAHLNVKGENDLIEAVKRCWATRFEPSLIPVQATKPALDVAVIVQKMVAADVSGVARSRANDDQGMLEIEAVAGLTPILESGDVVGDLYMIDRASMDIVSRTVGRQSHKLVRDDICERLERSGRVALGAAKAKAQKLPDPLVAEVAGLARRLESVLDGPLELGWAAYRGRLAVTGVKLLPGAPSPVEAQAAAAPATGTAFAGLASLDILADAPAPTPALDIGTPIVAPAPAPTVPSEGGVAPTGTLLIQLLQAGGAPAAWSDAVLVRATEALEALIRGGAAGREVLVGVDAHDPAALATATNRVLAALTDAKRVTAVLQGISSMEGLEAALDALDDAGVEVAVWVQLASPLSLWLAEDVCAAGVDGIIVDGESLFPDLAPGYGREALERNGAIRNALASVARSCRVAGLPCALQWDSHDPDLLRFLVSCGFTALCLTRDDASGLQTVLARAEMRFVLDRLTGE